MRDYKLDKRNIFISKSDSGGNQRKYSRGSYYYKVNKSGNEGLVEYLVYRLLCNSTLPSNCYASYEYCKINGRLGCRSKSFLSDGEALVSIGTLYKRLGGGEYSDYLAYLGSAGERINSLVNTVRIVGVSRDAFLQYLSVLFQLDMLISNNDRHVYNMSLILSDKGVRLAPIFDNGSSLCTDGNMHPCSCTVSGSFIEQVTCLSYPVKPAFKIDYNGYLKELGIVEGLYGSCREISVLRGSLNEYEYLFGGG